MKPHVAVDTANVLVSTGLCELLRTNAFHASVHEKSAFSSSAGITVVDTVTLLARMRKGFSRSEQRSKLILIDTGVASHRVAAVVSVFAVEAIILPEDGLEKLISAIEMAACGQAGPKAGIAGGVISVYGEERAEAITNREKEVVELVLQGLNNRQVGARLFISPFTVKTHLYSIYRKLGLSSRFDLIKLAYPVSSGLP